MRRTAPTRRADRIWRRTACTSVRRDYPIDTLPNEAARIVARALMHYGMFHADGGNVALAQSDRHSVHTWEEVGLEPRDLDELQPSDFEVIDHGPTHPVTYECECTPLAD